MDSRRFDVVVVVAGIAGLMAAGAAARKNQKVALIATGPGSFVLGDGCLKTLECLRYEAVHEFDEAIAFFREMTQAAGCPFEEEIQGRRFLPTILGGFESVALAPRSLWNAELRNGASTAIAGIREISCFDENFMAERLHEQARRLGFTCTYAARQVSFAHIFGCATTPLRIAARFDSDAGFRSELASALKLAAPGFERILMPAVLGLQSSGRQLAQFERELGCSVAELPTLPPSISGLRLFNRLWSYLHENGVQLFQGFLVQEVRIDGGPGISLHIASPGHPLILHGERVVLAAGKQSARLLGESCAGLDEQMHPLSSAGSVMAWNLFIAEPGACRENANSGMSAEILAGYRAGNLAAATRRQYAAG